MTHTRDRHLPGPLFLLTVCLYFSFATVSHGGQGDCGQPSSEGAQPTTSDARQVLLFAVGSDSACDSNPCICDVNSNEQQIVVTTLDALMVLRKSVGHDVSLSCCFP
jgi:hypothetical protein